MHTTPASLLDRLRQPAETEAWPRFVKLYTPLLFFWVRRLGLGEHDAADLVQEVFTTLLQKLPEFKYNPELRFRNWLHQVTLNKWREKQRRCTVPQADGGERLLADMAGPDNVAAWEEAEYRHHLVRRALELMQAEFQPGTWKACWEHLVCERSAADVARELGITENAVYVAKHRVLRRLRKELAGLLD
jgi:RNA polymerase sigma-70 factor (ECF subfamily)